MKKRIALWDNLKFLLITLVVIGHYALQYRDDSNMLSNVYYFIYTFHMPVFIFVTGLFSKRAVNEKDTKKVLPFLTCFLVTSAILFITKCLIGMEASISFFSPSGLPWYLMSMFLMYLITMVIKDYKPAYVLTASIIIGILAGFASEENVDKFTWMRTAIFYPFFYLGYCIDQNKIIDTMKKWYWKVISVVFFGGIYTLILLYPDQCKKLTNLCTARHPYSHLGEFSQLGWVYRILLYAICFGACFLIISITPKKKIFGVSKFGQRTLGIYMFHYVFIYIFAATPVLLESIKDFLPNRWDHVILLVAIMTTYICGNKGFDFISQKLFTTQWKLKEK